MDNTLTDLIAAIKAANKDVVININVNQPTVVTPAEDIVPSYDTDFKVGDRVTVFHKRHNGEKVYVDGTVSSIGTDDKGDYVRVDGDNGNHYRAGLKMDSERLGTSIVDFAD